MDWATNFGKRFDAFSMQISENPRRYQIAHRDLRRVLLARFPYCVYFREFPEVIIVIACMHGRRDPERWQNRR
jgi:plasmid stabilization system protein ParE